MDEVQRLDGAELQRYVDLAGSMRILPTKKALKYVIDALVLSERAFRQDASVAPISIEMLRAMYASALELEYPEMRAANGDVLPINTSIPAGAEEAEYEVLDRRGYAQWIGDDGQLMPGSSIQATRYRTPLHPFGHRYDLTIFDLERAAFANVPLSNLKLRTAREAHAAFDNWMWLFGDPDKLVPGLVTHPNLPVSLAPAAAAAPNGDNRDRLIESKSDNEIIADVADMIDRPVNNTIGRFRPNRIWMSRRDTQHLTQRRVGTANGTLTMMQFLRETWPDVQFDELNECDGTLRRDPRLEQNASADTSGVSGRFWLATSAMSTEDASFLRSRPFTQLPPQEQLLNLIHITHEKIGGCVLRQPLAFHRKDFIANSTDVAA